MLIANTPSFVVCHAAPFCASCQFRIEDLRDVQQVILLYSSLLGLGWVLCRDFFEAFLKAELTDHCVLV